LGGEACFGGGRIDSRSVLGGEDVLVGGRIELRRVFGGDGASSSWTFSVMY